MGGLVLGAKAGDVFDVGEHWIAVLKFDSTRTALMIDDRGDKFSISSTYETQIGPEVWLQFIPSTSRAGRRLRFIAPKNVAVRRRPFTDTGA